MQGQKLTFQEKILKHRLTTIYRIALGIVLLIAVILVIRIQIENKVYTGFEIVRSVDGVGSKESKAQAYNGNVLYYSRDGVSAYDSTGEQLWNQTYEMQSPIVSVAGEYVVAGDYKGNTIYIMNGSGLCGQININSLVFAIPSANS